MAICFELIGKVYKRIDNLWTWKILTPIENYQWPIGYHTKQEAQKALDEALTIAKKRCFP